jgi:hypothetical protein
VYHTARDCCIPGLRHFCILPFQRIVQSPSLICRAGMDDSTMISRKEIRTCRL